MTQNRYRGKPFPAVHSREGVKSLKKLCLLIALAALFAMAIVSTSGAAAKPAKFHPTPYHWVKALF